MIDFERIKKIFWLAFVLGMIFSGTYMVGYTIGILATTLVRTIR